MTFGFRRRPVTLPEYLGERTRSDCHGWSAYPIYHLFSALLGVRPLSSGFGTVAVKPQPGALRRIKGEIMHPRGKIRVACEACGGGFSVEIALPAGVEGIFYANGRERPLLPGTLRLIENL